MKIPPHFLFVICKALNLFLNGNYGVFFHCFFFFWGGGCHLWVNAVFFIHDGFEGDIKASTPYFSTMFHALSLPI